MINSKHDLKLVVIMVSIVSLISIWGCTSGASSEEKTESPIITFVIYGDPAEQAIFQGVINGFYRTEPGVRVQLIAVPQREDFMRRLTLDFAAGTPPDLFLLNYTRLAQFHNRDALEPLGPWLARSKTLSEADYYPIALDAFRDASGEIVCMPQSLSSQVIYYNQTLFDVAGLPYPDAEWTWDDLRQTAIKLTLPDTNQDGLPDQYGLGFEPKLVRVGTFIWQYGGTLVDDFYRPTRFMLDTPSATTALSFVTDLSLVDHIVPNRNAEMIQTQHNRFLRGEIAMYIDDRWFVPTVRDIARFPWDVAPLPHKNNQANVLQSNGYCLAGQSSHKAEAWQFLEFALSPEGQRLAGKLGRTVPSLKAVAQSDLFLTPTLPPANARVWLTAIPNLQILPHLENWAEIERITNTELELAYLGHKTLAAAVESIQATANKNLTPIQ